MSSQLPYPPRVPFGTRKGGDAHVTNKRVPGNSWLAVDKAIPLWRNIVRDVAAVMENGRMKHERLVMYVPSARYDSADRINIFLGIALCWSSWSCSAHDSGDDI